MDQRKIVFNSIRMRIVQFLILNQEATASQLAMELNEVPRTTLYRHINVLDEAGVIKVVSQRKIRGTIEKTYAMNPNAVRGKNDIETAKNNAFTFLMSIYGDFYKYFSDEETDEYDGRIFIKSNQIYLDDEEFDNFVRELDEVYEKYENLAFKEGRILRKITTISSPDNE